MKATFSIREVPAAPTPGPGLHWLLAAPHRLFFCLATVLLVAAMAGWALDVVARYLPLLWPVVQVPWPARQADVPAGWLHAVTLIYAALPAYIYGFALTAMPRWLNRAPVEARTALPGALLHAAGGVLLLAGVARWGLLLLLLGGLQILTVVMFKVFVGPHPDKRHATLLLGALLLGVVGLACGLWGSWSEEVMYLRFSLWAGLWGMLLPVNLVVSHRMLPFFTANAVAGAAAWRPFIPLYALIVAGALYGAAAELKVYGLAAVAAGLAAVISGVFSWRWYAKGVLSNRLLAMLHVSHAWLPVGFALAFVQQLLAAFGHPAMGLAPLHAIVIGFLLSIAIAMVSRVTLGHSGRHLSADRPTWILFWLAQLCTLIRVLSDLFVAWLVPGYLLAAVLLGGTLMIWAWRYVPIYLSARQDGQPG